MKDYFFVSEAGGNLHDTRRANWSDQPLRRIYKRHFSRITCGQEMRAAIRAGAYTFPGGYEVAGVTTDGGLLCYACMKENFRLIASAIRHNSRDGWQVVAIETAAHFENGETCDHCGKWLDAYNPAPDQDQE